MERGGGRQRERAQEREVKKEREGVQGRTGRNSECSKDYKENE